MAAADDGDSSAEIRDSVERPAVPYSAPPLAPREERKKKKRADGAPSEAQEAEGDKGDKAPSRVVCYLRAVFVFTFTTVIQSKNRQGSDKTLFWSSHSSHNVTQDNLFFGKK